MSWPRTDAERSGGRPTAVVLGDSFTVGFGASGVGYVGDLADQMGWTAVNAGQSGTGYVNDSGVSGQSVYGARIQAVVAEAPDLVLVQGSTNDVGAASAAAVGRAAQDVYAALHEQLPGVPVIVLGPLDAPTVDREGVFAVRDALADAAARAGLPFIDPIANDWLSSADLFADGLHPNDKGYAEFADDLAAELHALGF